MIKIRLMLILVMLAAPSVLHADEYLESRLNRGLVNSDAYAEYLMEKSKNDSAAKQEILTRSVMIAPDLPSAYFNAAAASFSPSGNGILKSIDYLVQGFEAVYNNFWWSFTLGTTIWLSLLFSFILAVSIVAAIRLFTDLPLISHDIKENSKRILLPALLVLLSLAGPLFLLAGLFMLLGIYMRKSDRILAYLYFVFLLLVPLVLKTSSLLLAAPASGNINYIVDVNEFRGNFYAFEESVKPADYISLFSRALALKREGGYDDAIAIYNKILAEGPDYRASNNLGNCYVGLYSTDETKKTYLQEALKNYSASLAVRPTAAAYYNMSVVSRELLDFSKGDEYFRDALNIDRMAVSEYRGRASRHPNRMVADKEISRKEIWKYVLSKPFTVSSYGAVSIPYRIVPLVGIILAASFYLLSTKLKHNAYRCKKCNAVICSKCENRPLWGQMCSNCFASLVKLDEMDAKERVSRILSIHERQKNRRLTLKVLMVLMPGAPQIFSGRLTAGFLWLWPFLFFLSLSPISSLLASDRMSQLPAVLGLIAVLPVSIIYALSILITSQRINKGWL